MLEKIVIISLLVWMVHSLFLSDMILGFAGDWMRDKFPQFITKPLFDCPVCMTPYYGSVVYLIVWGNSIEEYIVCVLCAMGLNSILVSYLPD